MPSAASPAVAPTDASCTANSFALPYNSPSAPAGLTDVVANTPVNSAPTMPPTP